MKRRTSSTGPFRPRAWRLAVLAAAVGLIPAARAADDARRPRYTQPVIIRFEGEITPGLEQYFYRKLEIARKMGADLVIVEIDSPGGYVISSTNIAEKLRDLGWAHTVAFVPREALSGASFVALGSDEIIMAPFASLGDAGPIFLDENFMFRHVPEKVRSELSRTVRDLAEAKGRPPALAEAMVRSDEAVYEYKNKTTGETAYMYQREVESSGDPGQWEKGKRVEESGDGRFLEVNGTRAVELGLAQGTAGSRSELLRRWELERDLIVLKYTGVDTTVYVLNNWFVTGLLFVIGLVALYIELLHPGISVGGLVAGLCFMLFFWSHFMGGTAGWLEVILFSGGLVFLAMELFVFPGFGVSGVTGILLVIASLLMAFQPEENGGSVDLERLVASLSILAASFGVVVGVAFVLSKYYGAIPVLNKFALAPPEPGDVKPELPGEDPPLAVGEAGVAHSLLRPAGVVRFGERYVDVITEGSYISPGTPVRIVELSGNRVIVREEEA